MKRYIDFFPSTYIMIVGKCVIFLMENCQRDVPTENSVETQISSDICPVTGLPITRRPEWENVHFGGEYRLKMSIKLATRINIIDFQVQVVKSYSEAVILARKMLSGTSKSISATLRLLRQ